MKLFERKLASHRWIVCTDAAAAFTPLLHVFTEVGAPKPLLLAGSEGTGPLPDPATCELVVLGTGADTMLGGIRAFHAALRNLPGWAIDRITAWDPEREALVMPSFLDTSLEIAGRPSWGARPESWLALEDKMIIDDLWDAAAVARAPSQIVGNNPPALAAATETLDRGAGVVWTADNRDGWHGGAEYSRYVTDAERAGEAHAFMAEHAHRVRVMPFLEGMPCAIHGLVFSNDVAVFRPVEMVVFRQPSSTRFRYASCATSWDPPASDRRAMRRVGAQVGHHLRTEYGFRGAFTVDGVLTADGFLPTELNPRYGAGIGTISNRSGMPLLGLSRMLIAGEEKDLDAAEIERLVLEAADRDRSLGGFTLTTTPIAETDEHRVRWTGSEVAQAPNEEPNATITIGPAALGSMVRFRLDTESIPVGRPAAPIVALGLGYADKRWELGIGELIPATPA